MYIRKCKLSLGIELGSTRIKAVLIDEQQNIVANGNVEWENKLIQGFWTYSVEEIWGGIQKSYLSLKQEFEKKYHTKLTKIDSIGISAMMHGYMAFDKNETLLVPFRTWRNSHTAEAEKELSKLFNFNIPQRWSIAHLYQAILDEESHVTQLDFLTTLSGYVHWKLTGKKVLGIGDASGMFPINNKTKDYDKKMLDSFNVLNSKKKFSWRVEELFPEILLAGEKAGELTPDGARLLDPSGDLEPGVPLCPPEGDAGTGMVATNSVKKRTGNVSAGTSVFSMIVLEHNLTSIHPEIDVVTTPVGDSVAMVHANNCTSDINAWVSLFKDLFDVTGYSINDIKMYEKLFNCALEGDDDVGGLLSYGYLSGENITNTSEGRPLFVRTPDSSFNLANFMKMHIYSAFSALNIGMNILKKEENVEVDQVVAHGGIFKTKYVAQRFLSAAIDTSVSIMENADSGGAWGIALLADYIEYYNQGESLNDYLDEKVFHNIEKDVLTASSSEVKSFNTYMDRYIKGLELERNASKYIV